jgi:hypothetical protein
LIHRSVEQVFADGEGSLPLWHRDPEAGDVLSVEKETAILDDLCGQDELLGVEKETAVHGGVQEEAQRSGGLLVRGSME